MLGPFELTLGELSAGPWPRPSARRLLQLVLLAPGRRITRDLACDLLFPHLGASEATNALRRALSMARTALVALGKDAAGLLQADRNRIWVDERHELDVDSEVHERALRSALSLPPGPGRDQCLVQALMVQGTLLDDEPYAEWALRPREALEALRQEARLALARDRAGGAGRSRAEDVIEAWEACLQADPISEEATIALVRAYSAQGRYAQATATFRRCCEALEQLGMRASPSLEQAMASTSMVAAHGAPYRAAPKDEERRLVSALFAELIGPTEVDGRLGPEDVSELVGHALAEIVAEVEGLNGTVSAVSGTGVVALFGAPESHEDDPERALRAALRSKVRVAQPGNGLSLRAGVETGPAVVGLIGGSGHHYGALGEVMRVAAALQSIANPGSVLVGPATYRATEGLFEWGATEEVIVYPGAKPVPASYLARPKVRRQGEGKRHLAGAAPLVGRNQELSVLRQSVSEVTAGKGGLLAISGEPGLGKTRLVQETRRLFMAWVRAAAGRLPLWLEGRAASYRCNRPYGLYQQLLCTWVGTTPDETEKVTRHALDRALKATYGAKQDTDQARLLAYVMGIGGQRAESLMTRVGPEKFQAACFSAVRDLLARLMAHGPTVLALEDLHWADPTSLRLTEIISALSAEGPLLIVLTRRPEPDRGTSDFERALIEGASNRSFRLELAPLAAGPEADLTRALLGAGLSDDLVGTISEGAEGNPLFLEERLASLVETNALSRGEDGCWHLDLGSPGQVPDVLDRLVRSRVDRLAPGPRTAVVSASVLGHEFSIGSLALVTDLNGDLSPAVRELCSANLLVELDNLPEPAYRFRHSLIRDAIYQGLLRQQRQHLHARAASGLEAASEAPEKIAGLLGRHYALAGDVERATHYLELAGDAAAATYANDEAIASYRRAIELFADEPPQATQAVQLWLKLGALFWRLGRYDEGRAALREAAKRTPDGTPLLEAQCYRWLGQLEIEDCRDDDAFAALDKAEAVLQACSDKDSQEWVENWLALQASRSNLHYWRAESDLQAVVLERARPLVDARAGPWKKADFLAHVTGHRFRADRFLVDERTIADITAARDIVAQAGLNQEEFHWHTLGFLLVLHGDLTRAETELQGALGAARRAGDKSLELANLVFLGWAYLRQHDVAGVETATHEASELLRTRTFPSAAMVKALQSWVAWKKGQYTDTERLATEALEKWRPNMVRYPFCSICVWPLIAVRLADGRHEEAFDAARELFWPAQMRFPAELEKAVISAISLWDEGSLEKGVSRLAQSLGLAEKLRFA